MSDILSEFWGFIVAALGGVVWLVRLEARSLRNSDDIVKEAGSRKTDLAALETRLASQRREDMDASKEARDATNATLAEIRADVKVLLGKR